MVLKYLLILLTATLSLGQFARFGNYYIFDLAAAIFAFSGLIFLLIKKRFSLPKYSILFLIFFVWAAASFFVNIYKYESSEIYISLAYLLRLGVYIFAAIVVYNLLNLNYLKGRLLEKTLILSALFLCAASALQLVFLPDFSVLDPSLGWDPHKSRAAGTFFDPNFLGAYLATVLVWILYRISAGNKQRIYIYSAATISIFIFLTFSRSAWAMTAVIIFMFGIFRYPKFLLLGIFIAFLAYFLVPRVQTRISGITDPADSARFRLVSWQNALEISKDNLLTGVGFNSYRYAQKEYGFLNIDNISSRSGAGSDSSFLFVLATTGIFGAIIYSVAWFFPFFDNLLSKNKRRLILISLIPALIVEASFINSLFYPQIMFVLFVTLFSSTLDI